MTDRDLRRAAPRTLTAGLAALTALALCLTTTPTALAADPGPATAARGATAPRIADLGPTTFTEPGPYAVGEATLKLPRNGAPVEVWYPARKVAVVGKPAATYDMVQWLPPGIQGLLPDDFALRYPSGGVRGVPVAPGKFPVVVFSHGFAGFRDQSSFLTAWLASWGFVVAAPDHYSRDLTEVLGSLPREPETTDVEDLEATLTLLRKKARLRDSLLRGHLDARRVAALGHSAGGAAAEAWTATDRRVLTFIALAGATVGAFGETDEGPGSLVPRRPGLIMAASADKVVKAADLTKAYGKLRSPKRLVVVGGGHHAFSDLCEIGASEGGLLAVADVLGIPVPPRLALLAADGCDAPALPPTEAWPAIRQVVVAQLRHVFGMDRTDAGLTGLKKAFPEVVEVSRYAG